MTDLKRQQTKIKRKTQRRNSLLKMTEMSTNTLKALDGANGKRFGSCAFHGPAFLPLTGIKANQT
jgi:hypothetical protein